MNSGIDLFGDDTVYQDFPSIGWKMTEDDIKDIIDESQLTFNFEDKIGIDIKQKVDNLVNM